MADLTTRAPQPQAPEADTRQADTSPEEAAQKTRSERLSRIINIIGHREETLEEPTEKAPQEYITGESSLEPSPVSVWEMLLSLFRKDTDPAKQALEQVHQSGVPEAFGEVLRQALDFGKRFRAFTEEFLEKSAQFLEEYRQIQAKLAACDLIPPQEALELLGISELRALVSDKGVQGIKPPYYCLPIDKVSYVLFGSSKKGPFPIGKKASIDLGEKRLKVMINDTQSLSMPALTAQDKHVYSAVTSLTLAGNEKILYSDIYQILSGREVGRHAIPLAAVQQIDTSLKKFANLFEAWEGDKLLWREPLLFFVARDEPVGGQMIRAITVIREPVLWRLAFVRRQITRIKMEYLRIGDYRTSPLKLYLLERIERIQAGADKKNNRSIRLDTLCAVLGADTPVKQKKLRMQAEKFLEFWTKVGYISKFQRNKLPKSKTITGWEIIK